MTFIEQCQKLLAYLKAEIDGVEAAMRAYRVMEGIEEAPESVGVLVAPKPARVVRRRRKPARRRRTGKVTRGRELTTAAIGYVAAQAPEAVKCGQVIAALGKPESAVRSVLTRAVEAGRLWQPERGYYKVKSTELARHQRKAQRKQVASASGEKQNARAHLLRLFAMFDGANVSAADAVAHFQQLGYSAGAAYEALSTGVKTGELARVVPGIYRVATAEAGASTH
jgi:predicted transcriptional regulator of viral defense system